MTSRFVLPFADIGSGITPSDGAKLTFKNPGLETLKNTFSDAAGSIANTNPVIADATGLFSNIYISGNYDVVLQDKNSVQIWADSVSEFQKAAGIDTPKSAATIASATANDDLSNNIGGTIKISEYEAGVPIDSTYTIVTSGTGTADGGSYHDSDTTNLFQLELITSGDIRASQFGMSSVAASADNNTQGDAIVIFADANNLVIDLEGLTIDFAALWHVNIPVSIAGNNANLTGGDADGVMWWGHRTGDSQNVSFQHEFVENITFAGTNNAGSSFTSSKSVSCRFTSLKGVSGAGIGLTFRAAVGCYFEDIRGRLNGFTGIVFTFFTNSDTTTHVPSTANTITNIDGDANGTDAGANSLNAFGVLCDKDPNGRRAAYGNSFTGGFVQENQFSGVRDFGDNIWNDVWAEKNGIDSGSTQQYNFWDSGPQGSIILRGRNQGAGVLRKLYVDGAVDAPTTKNVIFNGALQTDIQYEVTIPGTHTGSSNAVTLTDTSKAWRINALTGKVITNTTDGSTATITSNTEQTISGTLSGGTDDDWDTSDAYTIADAAPTNIVQKLNTYSGSSPEITPSAFDQRNTIIGDMRKNTFLGTQEDKIFAFDLAANTSGSAVFTSVGQVSVNTSIGLLSLTVFIDGTPPTLLGQVVEHSITNTGSNQFIRFTVLNTERFSATTTDSGTGDLPIIRITTAGDVQYKQNDGSSAQRIEGRFLLNTK